MSCGKASVTKMLLPKLTSEPTDKAMPRMRSGKISLSRSHEMGPNPTWSGPQTHRRCKRLRTQLDRHKRFGVANRSIRAAWARGKHENGVSTRARRPHLVGGDEHQHAHHGHLPPHGAERVGGGVEAQVEARADDRQRHRDAAHPQQQQRPPPVHVHLEEGGLRVAEQGYLAPLWIMCRQYLS
jgi:hypothetical protein